MQTAVFYVKTDPAAHDAALMSDAIKKFPPSLAKAILRYRRLSDQLLSFSGKLLLLKALRSLSLAHQLSLNDLQYTSFHRPYFNYPVDFNISHSGSYTLLAITTAGNVGVDIQLKERVDKCDFKTIFNNREWTLINSDLFNQEVFYKLWARKEAVVKAAGRGLFIPLQEVDVSDDLSLIGNTFFHMAELDIDGSYAASIATDFELPGKCVPEEVYFRECINECFCHQ